MKTVFCLTYIDTESSSIKRIVSPAGNAKSKYIINGISRAGFAVEVLSPAMVIGSGKTIFHSSEYINVSEFNKYHYAPTISSSQHLFRAFGIVLNQIWLLLYMLRNIKDDSPLIVYHSLGYMRLIAFLKILNKFPLILEIEEIYSDVHSNDKIRKRELAYFKLADAYIFSTTLLNEKINGGGKPFSINHGTYQVEKDREKVLAGDTIRIVYAGTFDPRKGGAAAAAAAAEFLDENYHIHILGFGSERDKEHLFRIMEETRKKTKCVLTYDGMLSGEEYIRFIQSCDIGLSTQNPDAAFNATSFPSKVLSYMANGLRVVSIRIEAVERSAVGDLITYYDEQTPESIAKAIRSVDFLKAYDSRTRIQQLDTQFLNDIKFTIEAVSE